MVKGLYKPCLVEEPAMVMGKKIPRNKEIEVGYPKDN